MFDERRANMEKEMEQRLISSQQQQLERLSRDMDEKLQSSCEDVRRQMEGEREAALEEQRARLQSEHQQALHTGCSDLRQQLEVCVAS